MIHTFIVCAFSLVPVVRAAMSLPSPDSSCTAFLSDLAIAFRDPDERHTYVARHPDFPAWFRDVVRQTSDDETDREQRIAVFKVVANFVADDG